MSSRHRVRNQISKLAHFALIDQSGCSKHPARLDRDFGRKKFGDEGYAREELVAEIGSAFLCCDLGIKALTIYAFSKENWKRPALETNALMMLLEQFLQREMDALIETGVRFRAIRGVTAWAS